MGKMRIKTLARNCECKRSFSSIRHKWEDNTFSVCYFMKLNYMASNGRMTDELEITGKEVTMA
jgi:hypothetical protein